jgi:hypothetical protein
MPTLCDQGAQWQTPLVPSGGQKSRGQDRKDEALLAGQAANWPTPGAMISNDGESPESWKARAAELKRRNPAANGNGAGVPLAIAAISWPTPDTLMNKSTRAMTASTQNGRRSGGGQSSPPGLEQVAKLASGEWPDEMPPMAALPPKTRGMVEGLWKTPHGFQAGNGPDANEFSKSVRAWATPKTATGGANSKREERGAGGPDLQEMANNWPTPAARDQKGANSEEHCTETGTGRKHMDQLPNFVEYHFSLQAQPTPDGEPSSTPVKSVNGALLSATTKAESVLGRRRLNPAFVCWLMGWPWWWTRAEPISFGARGMALWRSQLRSQLRSLVGGSE